MAQLRIFVVLLCLLGRRSTIVSSLDPIRAVNLGGWLVIEGWMRPSLFNNIPVNKDMLDGTQIQLQSLKSGKYVAAEGGGGGSLSVNRDTPSGWETFKLWRVSSDKFQLRVFGNQFIQAENEGGGALNARSPTASTWETFQFIRNPRDSFKVHIKAYNGKSYLQANGDKLTADYNGEPGWEDSNPAVFRMNIIGQIQGEWQLSNAYDNRADATKVLNDHRHTFITENDFSIMKYKKINAARVPVGWWIRYDQSPPLPFIAGSLQALDKAFTWGEKYGIKIIIDLHAAPGAQGVEAHSGSKDGTSNWDPSASLTVIDFLAQRYNGRSGLLGIELLNEPNPNNIQFNDLKTYYNNGYNMIRQKYSQDMYVIFCQFVPGDSKDVAKFMPAGAKNVVLDVHLYTAFDNSLNTVQKNLDYVRNNFQQTIFTLNGVGGATVFIGEWVNEWTLRNQDANTYNQFGDAQLEIFGKASFGWAYWALTNDQFSQWSFEKCILRVPQGNGNWPN